MGSRKNFCRGGRREGCNKKVTVLKESHVNCARNFIKRAIIQHKYTCISMGICGCVTTAYLVLKLKVQLEWYVYKIIQT